VIGIVVAAKGSLSVDEVRAGRAEERAGEELERAEQARKDADREIERLREREVSSVKRIREARRELDACQQRTGNKGRSGRRSGRRGEDETPAPVVQPSSLPPNGVPVTVGASATTGAPTAPHQATVAGAEHDATTQVRFRPGRNGDATVGSRPSGRASAPEPVDLTDATTQVRFRRDQPGLRGPNAEPGPRPGSDPAGWSERPSGRTQPRSPGPTMPSAPVPPPVMAPPLGSPLGPTVTTPTKPTRMNRPPATPPTTSRPTPAPAPRPAGPRLPAPPPPPPRSGTGRADSPDTVHGFGWGPPQPPGESPRDRTGERPRPTDPRRSAERPRAAAPGRPPADPWSTSSTPTPWPTTRSERAVPSPAPPRMNPGSRPPSSRPPATPPPSGWNDDWGTAEPRAAGPRPRASAPGNGTPSGPPEEWIPPPPPFDPLWPPTSKNWGHLEGPDGIADVDPRPPYVPDTSGGNGRRSNGRPRPDEPPRGPRRYR
jgi:hypothetical protein